MEVPPYLRDHHFEGKVILPAVETLIVLANVVKLHFPAEEYQLFVQSELPPLFIHCTGNAALSRMG